MSIRSIVRTHEVHPGFTEAPDTAFDVPAKLSWIDESLGQFSQYSVNAANSGKFPGMDALISST